MSEESAKAFLKKAGEDKEFQEKIMGTDSEEKLFAVAKGNGFHFTKEEWLAVVPKNSRGTLTDSDLEQATGGNDEDMWCICDSQCKWTTEQWITGACNCG